MSGPVIRPQSGSSRCLPAPRLTWLLFTWLLAAAPAPAHTRSETHSSWQIAGTAVRVQFTVPELEARRLASAGVEEPSNEELISYLSRNLGATSQGRECPPSRPPRAVDAAPGYRRFEFQFRCDGPQELGLYSTAFVDLVATHTNFAQIRDARGNLLEQLITKDHPRVDLGGIDTDSRLQNAGFMEYVLMGVMHIFTGVDHQAFLLGLVLISRRVRDLVFVVTGFTLGHSLTLALAVTGVIRPHAEYIDALVGLTIALIGAENIIANSRRPMPAALGMGGILLAMAAGRWFGFGGLPILILVGSGLFAANYLMVSGRLRDAARLRVVVTLVFGLIHGFGFASNLLEMQLPAGRLAELLVGFNLGVELGQLTIVGVAYLAGWAALQGRIGVPRRWAADIAAACLIGFGMYWFVQRSYA
jgi:hypothetical protein